MGKTPRAPGFVATLAALSRSLAADLFGEYRPELHYMRGPGPKWREKHAPSLHASDLADDDARIPSVEALA
jgi:hypothetical protein